MLDIGESDYYDGEWYNGMMLGQGEMLETYDDGTWKLFKGEIFYNQPAGKGEMSVGSNDGSYRIKIQGDFSDESTLMFFMTDKNGKLINIGGIKDGEYVSYVGETNVKGMIEFMDLIRPNMESGYASWFDGYTGNYIGETDSNGVPNGYGYSITAKIFPENEDWNCYYYKLGTWKDGKLEGYYTEWRYENHHWSSRFGCMKDGEDVGECVIYSENSDYMGDHILVTAMDCHDPYEYQLCEDGKYRTGYITKEYHYKDGTSKVEKYLTLRTDLEGENYWYEGEYTIYDANGNVIECGIADSSPKWQCYLYWKSNKDIRKDDILDGLAVAAGVGAGIAVIGLIVHEATSWGDDFESSAAGSFLNNNKSEFEYALDENRLSDELEKKAREQAELGNTYEANKLYEEAKKHRKDMT